MVKKIVKNQTDQGKRMRKLSKFKGNIRRLWAISVKFLKSSYRDKPMYFWVFGYPLLFMFIYFVAFSGGGGGTTYNVAFLNNDGTLIGGQNPGESIEFGSEFFIDLFDENNPSSNLSDTFHIQEVDNMEEGIEQIQGGALDAIIIIPANFSELLYGEISGSPKVKIFTSPDPYKRSIIPNVISSVVNSMILEYEDVDSLDVDLSTTGEIITPFDWMMPGIVIAGTTVAIMNVAQLFGKEKENGLMERLETTPVPRSSQLLGGALAQMIFSTIQGAILLLCLVLFGVNLSTNANWGGAILIVMVTAFMCIGLGLIIASIVQSADSAGGLSWIIILPLQFFGGTLMDLGTVGFPTYYSVIGIRNALIDGFTLLQLLPDIGIILGYGLLFSGIALFIYNRRTRI